MERQLKTEKAPKALGPYSQGISAKGTMIFVSGQIPLTSDGILVSDDIKLQTKQCMSNIGAILEKANCDFSNIVKVGIFLKDLANFDSVNEVYGTYFTDNIPPARSCVEVSRLPKDVEIEIEAIAIKEEE